MRTIIAVVIALSTSIVSAAWLQVGTGSGPVKVKVTAASALGATVTVEVPGIQTESVAINGAQYLKLAIPGAVSAGLAVGKPEVPAVPVLLARPTGSTVTLTILSIKTETLDVARVYPMQRPLKYDEHAGPLTVDNSFYASDVEYPTGRLSSPRTATWRDLDVVNVHVYPVAVRPAQHQVIVTSRIKFRVDFSGGHYPARVTSWMVPMYRRLVQNYDQLGLTAAAQEPSGTKCLVFCDSAYVVNPALDSLLSLMTKLGDSTEVINVPDSVQAVPEDIKNVIINRYKSQDPPALHWVFLVGNYTQIPPKPSYPDSGTPHSDYWYSDLDPRGNGYEDSCDNYPEVGIARLSPDDAADLSHQIAKIRDYMLGTGTGVWLNRMTLVSAFDTSADTTVRHVVRWQDSARFFRYSLDTIFGRDTWRHNSDIRTSVDNGTGVLIYLGHGQYYRWLWKTQESWSEAEVDGLDNPHTPVVFNLACMCGYPDFGTWLSEKWMSKYDSNGKGAVASFGAYTTVPIDPTDEQCMVAVKAIEDYDTVRDTMDNRPYVAPVFDLGGIQMLMDADVAKKWPNDTYYWRNIYGFYWLGNPAMPVWSGGVPVPADVSYPSWITPGDDSFPVTVAIGGLGVEDAQVCAYKPGDFYVVGSTDKGGTVTLRLTAKDTGSFFVSASKGHVKLSDTTTLQHTPMLPYFGASVVCKPDSDMTYPNWGRKLVRDPGNGTLHVFYTGRHFGMDSVFYKQSTDGGATWPIVQPIGEGAYPASDLVAASSTPWVAYVTSDGSIVRAIRNGSGAWDKVTIFPSTAHAKAGAPSLAANLSLLCIANAGVTYPVCVDTPANHYYVFFNAFFAASDPPSLPETVDAGTTPLYGASIVVSPGCAVHVSWIRGQSVFYRQRSYNGVWSAPYQISSRTAPHVTEPASNPSMEAYGDSVFCVWCGPHDSTNLIGEIWRRSRWLPDSFNSWRTVWSPCSPCDSESNFPVMTTSFATVWQQRITTANDDIWGRFLVNPAPEPFFETSMMSRYPQADGYWLVIGSETTFVCNTVWTEMMSAMPTTYAVQFGVHDYVPQPRLLASKGRDYEPALYYAAELGQPRQSPYCLSRGGFAQFESWNTDTSATGLTYQLPYLDPRRTYKLCAVLYHEGDSTWNADLRCDSGPWHRVRVAPNVPDTFWLQVPKALYKDDARIVVDVARLTGGYVSLARLKLYQIEELPGDDGGVQSWGSGMTFVTRLRGCSPNPFARGTSINYELAQYGPVELTIHDVSGRLVRRLECGPRQRGFHAVRWDGTDNSGRVVPAGVYFVRLSAGGKASTGRLTLVR